MKRICLLVCCLTLVTMAVFASPRRGNMNKATCIASCGGGVTVSCSYNPPSTCIAVDRNCPSQRGYVSCNGNTVHCPTMCGVPVCTEGAIRLLPWNGNCCDEGGKFREREQCVGGQWVFYSTSCGGLCGPILP